ncbi:MAG: DNA ligase, partial [Alicyclobacillus macrosporangiidus]|uniref:ATP-dependent DNA ligase n=1 Tax=Alicyclobacillus macrosporangiidus TaxID=392015 RepID=UPI0026F1903F
MLFTPIKPMLPTMHKEPFDDPNFIFEPKWDGWRILLHKNGDRVEAFTRNGRIVTDRFPELREAATSIRSHSAILDCEGICLRDGRSVFDDVQYRGRIRDHRRIQQAMQSHPVTFVAFDVLYTDSSHMNEPLMDRKERLFDLVKPSSIVTPTMFDDGAGVKLKKLTEQRNWEGIVSKRKDSLYIPGTRTAHWLKIKNWKEIDAVILGYRREPQFGL